MTAKPKRAKTRIVADPGVVWPVDGLETPLGRLGTFHKLQSHFVDGRLTIVEHALPPRRLAVPLHRHSREDELSFVLDGQLGALLGDEPLVAGPGSYVLKPRGQWHTVWNAGDTPLRFMELIIPGGLEGYLERLSLMLSGAVAPAPEVIQRTAVEYGIEFDFASVTVICKRFGLSLEAWPNLSISESIKEKV